MYTSTPTKLRITQDAGADAPWTLDAIDARTTPYAFTEQVWTFHSHAEAVAAMPEFIAQLSEYLPSVDQLAFDIDEDRFGPQD